MEWERPISMLNIFLTYPSTKLLIVRETARRLLDGMPTTGLRVLNIGFGVGMVRFNWTAIFFSDLHTQIDTYFQDAQPAEHVIIEGHPTCLGWMRRKGWYDRPGVRILEGRWQDFFPCPEAHTNQTVNNSLTTLRQNLLRSGQQPNEDHMVDIGKFDVVYFDTFEEGYRGHFAFIKNVPGLLRGPGSRFSYFNGHAALAEVGYIYDSVLPFRPPIISSLQIYPSINLHWQIYGGCRNASQWPGYEHRVILYVTSHLHILDIF